MKAYGQPARIDKSLLKSLMFDRVSLGVNSISAAIKFHRSHSRRFLKFNREFSRFVKDRPTTTLREFYDHCLKTGVIKF